MLESLNYSFRNPKNIIWVIDRIKQLRNYTKTMGSTEDPSLVNNVDDLGLVFYGLTSALDWMGCKRQVPAALPVGKRPITHHLWGWVGSRATEGGYIGYK